MACSTQIQFRRGTTAQNAAFTGVQGEVTYDVQTGKLITHDGATLGGTILPTEAELNAGLATKQNSLGYTPEDSANKTNDTTLAGDSATLYPTEHATKTYVDTGLATKQNSLGFTPENVANKTNDTTLAGDSATLYPTEHAAKTYADVGLALKLSLIGGTMSGVLNMGSQLISALATPISGTDAATKNYVDSFVSAGLKVFNYAQFA